MSDHSETSTATGASSDQAETTNFDKLDKLLEQGVLNGLAGMDRALVVAGVFLTLVWGLFVYFATPTLPFVHEDFDRIVNNPAIHYWTTFSEGWNGDTMRPLTALSYSFDWALGNGAAGMFHLSNTILHVLNAALVFLLCRRLLDPGRVSEVMCLAASLLFLIHPATATATLYVSERGLLLGTFFGLLTLLLYLSPRRDTRPEPVFSLRLAAAMVAFTLAWAAHVSVWILPILLAVADVASRGSVRWSRVTPMALLAAAFVVVNIVTRFALGESVPGIRGLVDHAAIFHTLVADLIAPGTPLPAHPMPGGSAIGHVGAAAAVAAGILLVRVVPTVGFAVLWPTLLFVAPGLVTRAYLDAGPSSAYIPLAGLLVMVPAVLSLVPVGMVRVAFGSVVAGLLLALSVLVHASTYHWSDEAALLERTFDACGECGAVNDRLGAVHVERARVERVAAAKMPGSSASSRAQEASLAAYQAAIPHLERSVARHPDGAAYWILLGEARGASGDLAGRYEAYDAARRAAPWSVEACTRLAEAVVAAAGSSPSRESIALAIDLYAAADRHGRLSDRDAGRYAALLSRIGAFERADAILRAAFERSGSESLRELLERNARSLERIRDRESALQSLEGRRRVREEARLLHTRGYYLQAAYRLHADLRDHGFDSQSWILLGQIKRSLGQLVGFLEEFRQHPEITAEIRSELARQFEQMDDPAAAALVREFARRPQN